MTIVAIIGAGLMGSAVAYPLSDNGHKIRLVGTHLDGDIIKSCIEDNYHPKLKRLLPTNVTPFYSDGLDEALSGAEIVVCGVNSLGVHWFGKTIGPYLEPGQLILAITKGLEVSPEGELIVLPDVLRSEFPETIRDRVALAAVGGPCIAGELAGRRHSLVVYGSRSREAVKRLAATFRTTYYHIWTTTDLIGLEYSAALKNAYTLGVGLAAGMLERSGGVDDSGAYMYNLAAGLFGASTREIERMLEVAGANCHFAYELPGAGDLFVTCMGGRTVRLGKLLGSGLSFKEAREIMSGETLESVEIIRSMSRALPILEKQGKIKKTDLPLMRALIDIVIKGRPIELPLDELFGEQVHV
jgi:glycerol-3-phosphate dehydrogenase (NAD(P)+)